MSLHSIKIATYNIFGTPQSFEGFLKSQPFWPERLLMPEVAQTLRHYDIVCIQENFLAGMQQTVLQMQRQAGFPELWADPQTPCGITKTLTGSGLAILSRFPLDVTVETLEKGGGPDGLARKGFCVARVRLPSNQEIWVYNTHVQADDFRVGDEECRRIRKRQLEGFLNSVRQATRAGIPTLVCGDFNVPANTDEYDEIAQMLLPTHADPITPSAITYDTIHNDMTREFHSGGPAQARLDYIWVDRNLSAEHPHIFLAEPLQNVPARPSDYHGNVHASDHYGLGLTVHLPP